jgi:hypothetical protein
MVVPSYTYLWPYSRHLHSRNSYAEVETEVYLISRDICSNCYLGACLSAAAFPHLMKIDRISPAASGVT